MPHTAIFWDRQTPKSLFCHKWPSCLSFPSSGNFRCVPCAQHILFFSEYSKTFAKHCFSCLLYSKHGSAWWVSAEVEICMTGVTTKRRVISHLPLSTSFLGATLSPVRAVVLLSVTLDWCVLCLAYFVQYILGSPLKTYCMCHWFALFSYCVSLHCIRLPVRLWMDTWVVRVRVYDE